MALILTFLGKGGTGKTTMAIAAAKSLAAQGKRVLLASQDASPTFSLLLGVTVGPDPQEIAANLKAVQFESAVFLERSWEQLKKLEAEYIRTPFFKEVYGQELGVLPGMDSALALNAIREYDATGDYDAIVYDGSGDKDTLRMLGMPEILSWYLRRFKGVLADSDLGKALSPFVQPVTTAIFNVGWSSDDIGGQPAQEVNNLLDRGKAAVSDPSRVVAYLVTTNDRTAVAKARYLWGSAQQVGLTVPGVLVNQASVSEELKTEFAPLNIKAIPQRTGDDWQAAIAALPDLTQGTQAPRPVEIDVAAGTVRLYLPTFDKKQVKLMQYGPEVTIEAGDQRRNIFLPNQLRGKPVKGAKFQNGYLIISF
jgi:anion-transporting  ArsA/GET3 family ATPase